MGPESLLCVAGGIVGLEGHLTPYFCKGYTYLGLLPLTLIPYRYHMSPTFEFVVPLSDVLTTGWTVALFICNAS